MTRLRRSFIYVAITTGLASSLSLIGGLGLEHISDRILPLVPLLIALPGLNDLVGDYASIIAAHSGDPNDGKRSRRDLFHAIFKVIGVNITAIILLSSLSAWHRGYLFTADFMIKFVIFVAVAAVLTVLSMFSISATLRIVARKYKINPDEVLVPVITSVADVIMLLLVTLAVIILF